MHHAPWWGTRPSKEGMLHQLLHRIPLRGLRATAGSDERASLRRYIPDGLGRSDGRRGGRFHCKNTTRGVREWTCTPGGNLSFSIKLGGKLVSFHRLSVVVDHYRSSRHPRAVLQRKSCTGGCSGSIRWISRHNRWHIRRDVHRLRAEWAASLTV